MSTTRQYQFDVDTKRYLNRVNTYRSLNGLPNIQKSDAADIDNFVIGLKDLGIWSNTLCFLTRSTQNVGIGNVFYPIGGRAGNNVGGIFTQAGAGTSTWTVSGIKQNVSTSGGGLLIGLFCNLTNNPQTTGYTMFGCLDVNNNGFYALGSKEFVNNILDTGVQAGSFSNSRRTRLTTRAGGANQLDITTAESIPNGQFFVTFAFVSTTQAIVKNNNFNGVTANGNYVLPPLNQLTFGTSYLYLNNYGSLVTQAMFGVVYHTNIANQIGNSFYDLYRTTIGKGLSGL